MTIAFTSPPTQRARRKLSALLVFATTALGLSACSSLQGSEPVSTEPTYDAARAERLGADDYGMRTYIFTLLKTGPKDNEITDKDERADLFKGHFANIRSLAEKGDLVLAGPMDGVDGWRGIFVLKTDDMDAAKAMMQGDPTIVNGLFELEYHRYYGTAALLEIQDIHLSIAKEMP